MGSWRYDRDFTYLRDSNPGTSPDVESHGVLVHIITSYRRRDYGASITQVRPEQGRCVGQYKRAWWCSARYGLDPRTAHKRKRRAFTHDVPTGRAAPDGIAARMIARTPCNPVSTAGQGRRHTGAINTTASALPDAKAGKPAKKKFKNHPIGCFHADIAGVRTRKRGSHVCSSPSAAHQNLRPPNIILARPK